MRGDRQVKSVSELVAREIDSKQICPSMELLTAPSHWWFVKWIRKLNQQQIIA
jgi:hypothetical protein